MDINPQLLLSASAKYGEVSERDRCESSLYEFLKRGWRYIDPAPFVGGWHLEAIAEHLQAVTDGQIRRLIINVPPRTSKSSLCSVAWPAWTWAQSRISPCSGPQVQFLSASYAQTLSLRDSVKNRRLIESPFFKKYWGNRFAMTSDVNTKGRFENDKGGYRIATSVDGALTGEGAQIILIDDPHNATEVESDLVRVGTLQWWDEAMSTRLNDQHTGAYVVIMQRLHQEDLTGHILSREKSDWTWLMLPMEHEIERHCTTMVNGVRFWEDPRITEGEMLCPERFNPETVQSLTRRLGPFSAAGQLQQSPVPRGGGIIKEEWWGKWREPHYPAMEFIIASIDTAYTEKEENDASALTIWGVYRNEHKQPRIMLMYGWQDRLAMPELVQRILATCDKTIHLEDSNPLKYKPRFKVDRLIIESKASGISVYQEIQRVLSFSGKFGIELFNPTKLGDKHSRVYSIQHLFSEGLVTVPWPEAKGEDVSEPPKWAKEVIDQVTLFPRSAHDDLVDSMSMALRWVRDSGVLQREEEAIMDDRQELMYRGKSEQAALYPV